MPKKREFKSTAPNVSLADLVHQRIVEALVTGQFKGGEELNEVGLAAQFRVSRTPVREALRRLAAEGLAVNQRNKQTTVIQMSHQDIIETYQIRQALEAAAARLAAPQIDVSKLVELRSLAEAATPTRTRDGEGAERQFDDELHRAIAEASGNAKLLHEIQKYQNLVRFLRARLGRLPHRKTTSHAEHLRILEALERRDPQRAEMEMAAHIAAASQSLLEELNPAET